MGSLLLWLVIVLALIGIAILAFRIRRRKSNVRPLEKDGSGFWKYHSETVIERKKAYAPTIGAQSGAARSAADDKAVVVIRFDGDIRGSRHDDLAAFVDEIDINRELIGEVVVVVDSHGGLVSPYGHAFAEMERIKRLGLQLTVCVDEAAASGGYLMSIPADKIIAAPFAMVGSVGVAAFVPNFRALLNEWKIRPRTFTAGSLKRTVTFTDEENPERELHFQRQLDSIHRLFLELLKKYRPAAALERIETGDHWTAKEAVDLSLGLVDEIGTSAEYLLELNRFRDLIVLSKKKSFFEDNLGSLLGAALRGAARRFSTL